MTDDKFATLRRVIVSTSDLARADEFYGQLLRLPLISAQGGFRTYDLAGGHQLLLHERATEPSDTAVSLGFTVADLDTTVDRWRQHGGIVLDEPEAQPWGEVMAVVRDPDGHVVCLSQR
ncbi:VOC family protein [Curtobacterium sp. RRHDQ10]|uniref:VOC family protein n=1 Tax=Curtobacterium phyllosphaerae TaxID=3413379 RepID=UPI003BF0C99C